MDGETREILERLNARLEAGGVTPYKLDIVDPAELVLLEKNARFMTKRMFDVLTRNIERQGLSSVPFCYYAEDGKKHVLSGNHRVKSAMAAGKKAILVLYTDRQLTREEQVAIQLAHNQVTGQDDPQILRSLWEEIETVGFKELTGFDDEYFSKLESVTIPTVSGMQMEMRQVTLFFIVEDYERIDEILKVLDRNARDDAVLVADMRDFENFFEAVVEAKERANVVNTALAVRIMAEYALKHLEEKDAQAAAQAVQLPGVS